jgi:VWFA-related protein
MVLDVVVTSKSGAPVQGLKQQDFTILDNKKPQTITGFAALGGPQAPIEVVIVVDRLNTTLTTATYERAELERFLKAGGGHLPYPTSLAVFNDNGISLLGDNPSQDGNELSSIIDHLDLGLRDEAKFSTTSGEADKRQLSVVAAQRLVTMEAARPGRKIILWVSQGWPLLSAWNLNYDAEQSAKLFRQTLAMSNLLRRSGVTLYSINPAGSSEGGNRLDYENYLGGTKPSDAVPGYTSLQVMAAQSGGMALTGSNDIAGELKHCLADLTAYYELTFDPPPGDRRDDYHTLQVKVSQAGLTARTRTGYYSEP